MTALSITGSGDLLARPRGTLDPAERDGLVRRFLPLAHSLARRYVNGSEPLEDLEQVAALGLIKAIDRFDPARGYALASFAVPTILGELRRHFRSHAWVAHVPRSVQEGVIAVRQAVEDLTATNAEAPTPRDLAEHIGCSQEAVVNALLALSSRDSQSLDAPVASEAGANSLTERLGHEDSGYERAEHRDTLRRLMPVLTDREQHIVLLRFWDELTQTEIAERVGISQMQISRILRGALARLQEGV